jgi:predicted RNase H-like HicB family nuclease
MLTEYIQAAMRRAKYEIVEDDNSYYGHIPGIRGLWANAATLEDCRAQLEQALEDWLVLSIADHSPIPEMNGIRVEVREVA